MPFWSNKPSSSNKPFRELYFTNAALAAAKILEGEGLRCVVEGEMAAYLQGAKRIPINLTLVVGRTSTDKNSVLERQSVERLLIQKDPTHFRLKSESLQYVDTSGNIPEDRKKSCRVDITVLQHPPNPIYHPRYVGTARGLTVVTVVQVIAGLVRKMLEKYDSVPGLERPPKWPTMSAFLDLEDLVNVMKRSPQIPLHPEYKVEIKPLFQRLLSLLPEYKNWTYLLKLLIHRCDPSRASSSVQPASPSRGGKDHPPASQGSLPIDIAIMVAKDVVGVLEKLGIPCAVFGSMACALYGNRRWPNDIDLLTFPTHPTDIEKIKKAIFDSNPNRYSLDAATDPAATFKILFYRLDELQNPRRFFRGNKCKIDILIPGVMHLPNLPPSRLLRVSDLPVVPFSVLLLHKLQGWDDHRKMQAEPRKFEKRLVDVKDLENLMRLETYLAPLRISKPWKDEVLFGKDFQELSSTRARELCQLFPKFRKGFALLGISV